MPINPTSVVGTPPGLSPIRTRSQSSSQQTVSTPQHHHGSMRSQAPDLGQSGLSAMSRAHSPHTAAQTLRPRQSLNLGPQNAPTNPFMSPLPSPTFGARGTQPSTNPFDTPPQTPTTSLPGTPHTPRRFDSPQARAAFERGAQSADAYVHFLQTGAYPQPTSGHSPRFSETNPFMSAPPPSPRPGSPGAQPYTQPQFAQQFYQGATQYNPQQMAAHLAYYAGQTVGIAAQAAHQAVYGLAYGVGAIGYTAKALGSATVHGLRQAKHHATQSFNRLNQAIHAFDPRRFAKQVKQQASAYTVQPYMHGFRATQQAMNHIFHATPRG